MQIRTFNLTNTKSGMAAFLACFSCTEGLEALITHPRLKTVIKREICVYDVEKGTFAIVTLTADSTVAVVWREQFKAELDKKTNPAWLHAVETPSGLKQLFTQRFTKHEALPEDGENLYLVPSDTAYVFSIQM